MDEIENLFYSQEDKLENIQWFKKIDNNSLSKKGNEFYNNIIKETQNIYLYLKESILNFHDIFQEDLHDFEDALKYLEKISIPNKCVCAAVIDIIPGWKCLDCSKDENSIYCNDCFKKSKHLHKNHKIYFLQSGVGMCDCGDPNYLSTFCPEHSGPFIEQKQINEYISKIFPVNILKNLKSFFDKFFLNFSKYFILTENFDLFYTEIFNNKFDNITEENQKELFEEKNDIILLKNNFCIIFWDFILFLRLISKSNLGILHLIAKYFIKNNLENQKDIVTNHSCIKISENDLNIIPSNNQNHICQCPFLRLLISNWRRESDENEIKEFLLSFSHNLPLRRTFCILHFFLYKKIMLNNNYNLAHNIIYFSFEDVTELISKKSTLIKESYEVYYEYLQKQINSLKIKNESDLIDFGKMNDLNNYIQQSKDDTNYFPCLIIRKVMTENTSIIKKLIDCFCLIHNEIEFKSIVPHPQFQQKKYQPIFIEIELGLLNLLWNINMFIDWDKLINAKDILNYIIKKIMNQESEGIKQLNENEYSFHLSLYRCFGLLINFFCFNYAIKNKCTIIDSILFFKKNFFKSQEDVEIFADKLLFDYFRFFGFLGGTKNNYFNYYDSLNNYSFFYFEQKNLLKIDFSLIKYLFSFKEKNIDINNYLRINNIENVYSLFDELFLSDNKIEIINKNGNKNDNKITTNNDNIYNSNNNNDNLQINDFLNVLQRELLINNNDYNYIMQWEFSLELLINLMKEDSSPFWNLLRFYKEPPFSKCELFNYIKDNKYIIYDLKNILKEKIIQKVIVKGNIIDLETLKKELDEYLILLFTEDDFNKIINEFTLNKINKDTKIFYLKDSCLKYLDMNYYISPKDKSNAQKYILDFKKDVIKLYNNYCYNPSKLSFDFFKSGYEKILLNKNNLELMIKIIKTLLNNNNKKYDIKSIKKSILPIILNYLSIFGTINTKSFIKFKIENEDIINNLSEILSNISINNSNNEIIEKDLEENIKEVINQLDYYKIIYNDVNKDLSKLNDYDYNIEYVEKLKLRNLIKKEDNSINIINESNMNLLNKKKMRTLNIKEKLKNIVKNKSNLFLEKIQSNKEILQEINDQNGEIEDIDDYNEEIMCFYCRNKIRLNAFDIPYGKTGLLINDFFYINSLKASVRNELSKIIKDNNIKRDNLYEKILDNTNFNEDKLGRIISCGHLFHSQCFEEGKKKNILKVFTCSLCLKKQNILIPPLAHFQEKYNFLKSEKINNLFDEKEKKIIEMDKEYYSFNDIIFNFLKDIKLLNIIYINKGNIDEYSLFLENIYPNYKAYFNFLENVFYVDGTIFHKQQQIYILKNIILSLRYLVKVNYIRIDSVINYIKNQLSFLIKGNYNYEKIKFNYENMYFINLFEKIILSLSILFDFDELKEAFKYIIYIFLPYIIFGYYLRDLIINNNNFNNININEFKNYVKNNHDKILKCFHLILQKLSLIKVLTDFSNKNEDIINTFNKLNIENLLSILNIEKLNIILKNENNNIINILEYFPQIFNLNDTYFKSIINDFDFNIIFSSFIINIKSDKTKINLTKELIIQFSPIKYRFTYLDNNIFDFIERNIEKKCILCLKNSRFYYICLFCGNKICHTTSCNNIFEHIKVCGGDSIIIIDIDNMEAIVLTSSRNVKYYFPLYINENGFGPSGYKIGNKFYLSHEKLKLSIRNYVCNEFPN